MTLDYKKMIEQIDELTDTDFVADMECKAHLHEEPDQFTQAEAVWMSELLSKIYSIAHCDHCLACGTKYAK